jgi:RNA 2',3'-cyclic 3'-phosphodiesterase
VRLFVALDLPESARANLADLVARLKSEFPQSEDAKVRWSRPEGMHIALKFIGHVDPAKLGAIRAALAKVRSAEPVEMSIRGLGFFPNERLPRVAWCGVEASSNLAQLAAETDTALKGLSAPAEARPFVPHLTLARFSSPDGLKNLIAAAGDLKSHEFGSAREKEFHLYESVLNRSGSGSEYKRLATFPFVGGNARNAVQTIVKGSA